MLGGWGHAFDVADVERHARESFYAASDRAIEEGLRWSISSEASKAFWTGIYTRLLAELGADAERGSLAAAIYEEFTQPHRYVLFPDALPALRELKATGYRIGVISNWEAWLSTLLDRLELTPMLEVAIISGAEGIEKPEKEIFQLALEKLDIDASRVAYVGDSIHHDVEPALAMGMGAVLIDRHNRHAGKHRPTIESLTLLPSVLA